VETHILPSTNPPSGVGEPATPVIGPAVANAVLAATGKATYRLPMIRA
jgi:isoquinoline 1-oxidoreductase beta subunit